MERIIEEYGAAITTMIGIIGAVVVSIPVVIMVINTFIYILTKIL